MCLALVGSASSAPLTCLQETDAQTRRILGFCCRRRAGPDRASDFQPDIRKSLFVFFIRRASRHGMNRFWFKKVCRFLQRMSLKHVLQTSTCPEKPRCPDTLARLWSYRPAPRRRSRAQMCPHDHVPWPWNIKSSVFIPYSWQRSSPGYSLPKSGSSSFRCCSFRPGALRRQASCMRRLRSTWVVELHLEQRWLLCSSEKDPILVGTWCSRLSNPRLATEELPNDPIRVVRRV